ncbi:DNA mismatch repair protein [Rhizopus microsporus]|uniref:DNA mismatch repair protein n=1 Tax=Rhizopus microsporus TaxID=58291 RepID=A0A1X0SF58_RHIZD|nr:DNA mismatch repair protein [Rhizopus microsporus]
MSLTTQTEELPDVERPEQQNFVKFFRSLDPVEEGTIRLFEREANGSNYYTFHGDDAIYIAETVYKTASVVKYWLGDSTTGLPTTRLSSRATENFLRDALLHKQLRIEIWKQCRTEQNRVEWNLIRKASPGNLQEVEDFLFTSSQMTTAPVVIAVKYGTSGENKSLIIQLGVKECILSMSSEKDYEAIKIKGILARCNVVVTERRKSDFDAKNVAQDLNRLVEGNVSIEALHEVNFGKYTLRHHDLSQYMRLDGSALAALNLMPAPNEAANRPSSLYGLLNKCKTAQGSRLFTQWLKQPLLSLEEIKLRQSLQEDHLKRIPDLHRLAKRFQRGSATLQDVVRIYQVVIRLPAMLSCLENRIPEDPEKAKIIEAMYTSPIRRLATTLKKLEELVETTIDLDALENHEYIIKAQFNDELQELRMQMNQLESQMTEEYRRVGQRLGLELEKKLKFEKHSLYGHCLRAVGRNESNAIRNKSEYIEYSTQKAGTLFASRTLKDLSARHVDLSKDYDSKQRGLVREVIEIVDSFAHVSVMAPIPYVRPTLYPLGQGNVLLKDARHPCLEMQDYVAFIPNDVDITRDVSELQIITGPNMGGKSTYIRQVGVIALMAQIGCFVPCASASLCIFDSILARVGAGDSQLRGVSTFMAEMLETATILKAASRNSLIIIDELGRGTSTYDGLGLAWAISEYIATNIRAFCLFATHFHELTTLCQTVKHVKNLHVEVHIGNSGDVTLLYKVNEGVGNKSFGIHVAELADFPKPVIELAKRKANELDEETEKDRTSHKKYKPEQIEEGDKIMQQMVQDIADASKSDNMNLYIQQIKDKYSNIISNNEYLKDLLLE